MKKIAFGTNLRRIFEERSLTLTKVSLATGIPVSTLCEWTAGREPKISDSLLRLTEYLGVSLDQLVFVIEEGDSKQRGAEATVFIELDGHRYTLKFSRVVKSPY